MNPLESVQFRRKLLFSATKNLISSRSCGLIPPQPAVQPDPWNIKAPDFTPKLYRSLSLPRIKRKNLHLFKTKSSLDEESFILEKVNKVAPSMLPGLEQKRHKTHPFTACYKPPGSTESKLQFVRTGKYPMGPYKNPKPHNFRPCAEGMHDMVTSLEKGPGCLIFKSQYLRPATKSQPDPNLSERDNVNKIDTFKPTELKWDPRLILPKTPWPTKSASYTRHRRRRGVYSAFMDRVEEKLTNSLRK
ncbi:uncharacterized protein LOC127430116 [Myxocyprinus asiaticus]|uniref:uncharacterized protein LOC127430116 n=1 Tax=Myxocyprinus asiaticus TaxID=70543 RepID=UPI00222370F2|nr:uncharacterized protein LOC127430116 [Myxocyprinus asiaticus]